MEVAAMSMALSQSSVKQQASLSVFDKAMDQTETSSNGLIKMMQESSVKAMQQSVQSHLGSSIDIKV
jgi:hypothetical protein